MATDLWKTLAYLELFICCVHTVHIHNPANTPIRGSLWGYGPLDGPLTWLEEYPSCNGSRQSPINLSPHLATLADPGPIRLVAYDRVLPATVENNGHTVVLSLNSVLKPYMFGGRLPSNERFEFLQLHWHWGSTDTQGSEHRLKDEAFPMEVHFVHWNTKYANVEEAVSKEDGLAVVAFLYQIQEEDNEDLAEIISLLGDLAHPRKSSRSALDENDPRFNEIYQVHVTRSESGEESQTSKKDISIQLESLLPKDKTQGSYYYYQGSLTTPTCDESVLWTIFHHPLGVSERQMEEFRKINGFEGETLSNNFRNDQPVGLRDVFFRNMEPQTEDNTSVLTGGFIVMLSVGLFLSATLVLLYFMEQLLGLGDAVQVGPNRKDRGLDDLRIATLMDWVIKNKYN